MVVVEKGVVKIEEDEFRCPSGIHRLIELVISFPIPVLSLGILSVKSKALAFDSMVVLWRYSELVSGFRERGLAAADSPF